jgi:ribosomal protein S18 acetylase RimI-like enzyme
MPITYRNEPGLKAEQLSELFGKSGIRRPIEDFPRLQKMIDNADLTITAWDKEKLVGIARAITDYSYCCYLSDLAVDSDYQGQGIGSELVRQIKAAIGEEAALLLVSAPEAVGFYPKIGMESIDNGFIIKRTL